MEGKGCLLQDRNVPHHALQTHQPKSLKTEHRDPVNAQHLQVPLGTPSGGQASELRGQEIGSDILHLSSLALLSLADSARSPHSQLLCSIRSYNPLNLSTFPPSPESSQPPRQCSTFYPQTKLAQLTSLMIETLSQSQLSSLPEEQQG